MPVRIQFCINVFDFQISNLTQRSWGERKHRDATIFASKFKIICKVNSERVSMFDYSLVSILRVDSELLKLSITN